ncbi:hypothetical protein EZV62_024246 [Acer yangbiense]|uniref:Protein FAR1-RELATED SEQUENCE n=1 Tax=Acer yangbiense TaxID=1000413 RepID=A0A5C7H5K3_9ROSI|nr:hypothetical protein EZV62_024246 [Acer yangbiense]
MHFFDGYVNSKTTLKQFVEQYENALRDKVEKESQADFASHEMKARIHCGISLNKKSGSNLEFEVKEDVKLVQTSRRVTFMVYLDVATCEVNCSYRLFEFKGVLCRHILAVDSDENCNEVMKLLMELKTKLQGKTNVACCSEDNGISINFMTNGKEFGGFAEEENHNILSSQQVRSKGHPPVQKKDIKD